MHFVILIGTTGSHLSLLPVLREMREPASQVSEECWLLSNSQESSCNSGRAYFWTLGLLFGIRELEYPLDLTFSWQHVSPAYFFCSNAENITFPFIVF